ncbi:MAG: SpoIID/LytB domain-containing protein [Bacteroidia bacterium]|nr:SpoIID/LytB domain-containing protein [Bacteroidia bacterium]
METPQIKVGIMAGKEISFTLEGNYHLEYSKGKISGRCKARKAGPGVELKSDDYGWLCPNGLKLIPFDPENSKFVLHDVTIGINFHWERKEDQVFKGGLHFISDGEKIHAINVLSIEDYLISVISSEMSATSSMELLKAHAVISRSWLLAQIQKNKSLRIVGKKYQTTFQTDDELIKWYDREDHSFFDVCADDHCQRYQGITRSTTPLVEKAVKDTHGEILAIEGVICDARFSKCCGGVTEVFENVWEPINHPYLQNIVDNNLLPEGFSLELDQEGAAKQWIMGYPAAFCNSSDKKVLKQVLNDYDQETNDFFRWKVVYSQEELSELVKTRSGIDFGKIIDLIPVERGGSARLIKLKIVGTLRTMIIGKELEIRKTLSRSHLYSSAFIIEKQEVAGSLNFILIGAGWGHGVGLCQIGAAVMGDKGYSYHEILLHYFRGAGLEHKY